MECSSQDVENEILKEYKKSNKNTDDIKYTETYFRKEVSDFNIKYKSVPLSSEINNQERKIEYDKRNNLTQNFINIIKDYFYVDDYKNI